MDNLFNTFIGILILIAIMMVSLIISDSRIKSKIDRYYEYCLELEADNCEDFKRVNYKIFNFKK